MGVGNGYQVKECQRPLPRVTIRQHCKSEPLDEILDILPLARVSYVCHTNDEIRNECSCGCSNVVSRCCLPQVVEEQSETEAEGHGYECTAWSYGQSIDE